MYQVFEIPYNLSVYCRHMLHCCMHDESSIGSRDHGGRDSACSAMGPPMLRTPYNVLARTSTRDTTCPRVSRYGGLGPLTSALPDDAASASLPVSSAARRSILTRAMRGPSMSTTVRV